jgi:hypothetical protein
MADNILIGEGRGFRSEPAEGWRRELARALDTPSPRLGFMTPAHHLVRDTVVRELPRHRAPLSPNRVAELSGLSRDEVATILDELEARLFFLATNADGDVSWAYPVTAEPTPHRLRFETGERMFAA